VESTVSDTAPDGDFLRRLLLASHSHYYNLMPDNYRLLRIDRRKPTRYDESVF